MPGLTMFGQVSLFGQGILMTLPEEQPLGEMVQEPPYASKPSADWARRSEPLPDSLSTLLEKLEVQEWSKSGFKNTHGAVEIGGIHGILPYSLPGHSPWNGYVKGDVGMELFGVPVKAVVDMGTDVPIRGQRNSVRLSFDAPRLMDESRWSNAMMLNELQGRLDSLERKRSANYINLREMESEFKAMEDGLPDPMALDSSQHAMFAIPDSTDLMQAGLGTADQFKDSLALDSLTEMPDELAGVPIGTIDTQYEGMVAELDSGSIIGQPVELKDSLLPSMDMDGLVQKMGRVGKDLEDLDAAIMEQRMQVERVRSIMQAANSKTGVVGKFLEGIEQLDLGACSPQGSEFLINGVQLQGISFEYEQKDMYLTFAKGRSFDDAWMNADPVSQGIRDLQESLFLTDAKSLNPRELIQFKLGYGMPGTTHLHVGYLRGKKEDVPSGVAVPGSNDFSLFNHVVELDLGYTIGKDHLVRLAYARSIVQGNSGEGTATMANDVSDLFRMGDPSDQAMDLGWSSNLKGVGVRAELDARWITPYFQSFGMGYLKSGSRSMEGSLSKELGDRFRLRIRYSTEEREEPADTVATPVNIQRGQLMLTCRATSALSLRFGVTPVEVRTGTDKDGSWISSNRMYMAGGTLRKRWSMTTLLLNLDLAGYRSESMGVRDHMGSHSVGLTVMSGEKWNTNATWSGVWSDGDTSVALLSNLSLQLHWQLCKQAGLDLGIQVPTNARTGWRVGYDQVVYKGFSVGFRGESFSRSDLFFQDYDVNNAKDGYNWTFLTSYQW
jgi:hypothetical protein